MPAALPNSSQSKFAPEGEVPAKPVHCPIAFLSAISTAIGGANSINSQSG